MFTRMNKMVEEEKRKEGESSSVVDNLVKTMVERKERSGDTAAAAEVVEAEAGGKRGTKQGGGNIAHRTAGVATARATAGTKATTGTAAKTHAKRRKELLSATTKSSAASEDTSTAHEEQANRVLDDIFQGLQAFRQAAVAAGEAELQVPVPGVEERFPGVRARRSAATDACAPEHLLLSKVHLLRVSLLGVSFEEPRGGSNRSLRPQVKEEMAMGEKGVRAQFQFQLQFQRTSA